MAKNYWSSIKNVGEQLAVGRAMLRQTTYGRGGVITVDVDVDGKVKFFIRSLGQKFDRVEDAIGKAASIGLNEIVSFDRAPGFSGSKHVPKHGSKYNQAAEMYNTIYDSLQKAKKSELKILSDAGIDTSRLRELALDIFTVQDKKGDSKRLANIVTQNRKKGVLSGAVSMTDDGARILRFRLGDDSLTSYQISLLRHFVGQGQLNPRVFGPLLADQAGQSTMNKFFDKLAKVGKREKGVLAPRDISLVTTELIGDLFSESPSDLIDGTKIRKFPKGAINTLRVNTGNSPNVLLLDPVYDLLSKYAGVDFFPSQPLVGPVPPGGNRGGLEFNLPTAKGKTAYYRGKDPLNFFGDLLDKSRFPVADRDKLLVDLQEVIRNFNDPRYNSDYNKLGSGPQTTANLKSDALKKFLIDNFVKSPSGLSNDDRKFRQGLVDDIYKSIEVAFDGSALMNEKYFKGRLLPAMKKERDMLLRLAGSNPVDADELRGQIEALNSDIQLIESNELYQFTGRGYQPGLGTFKTAWANTKFSSELEDFAMIVTPYDFKFETSMLNTSVLTFSNIGDRSPRVFLDAMAEAFQAEILLDDNSIDNMRKLGALKIQEVEDAINANYVPEDIIKNLQRSIEVNVSSLPSNLRDSAVRNRQYAQSLMDLYRSGVDIRTSPQLINMLYAYYQSQVIRNKEGQIQAVSPLTRTYAIASEASFIDDSILGKGFEKIDFKINNKVYSQDVVKFRVNGHRLGFAAQVAPQVKQALGGYDNDDTVSSTMRMFSDKDGNAKLGFYVTRGPTGFQEAIFTRAVFDSETINYQFGEDEYFVKTLQNMLDGSLPGSDPKHTRVQQVILNNLRSKYKTAEYVKVANASSVTSEELEGAIINVYETMRSNNLYAPGMMTERELQTLLTSGSTALRINPLDYGAGTRGAAGVSGLLPDYQGDLVTKIMTKASKVDAEDDILKIIRDNPVDPALKSELLSYSDDINKIVSTLQSAINDMDNMSPGLSSSAKQRVMTKGTHAMALLEQLSETAQLRGAALGGDILGVYVNRSMLAGSMMPQFQEAYKQLGKSAQKFARENLGFALLEPEEAIDLQTTFSGLRELEDIDEIIAKTGADRELLKTISGRLSAIQQEGANAKKATGGFLDVIGKDVVGQVGRSIGFMRAMGIKDPNLQLGLDKVWIETRLDKGDSERILKQVVQGFTDARGQGRKLSKEIIEMEGQITKLLEKGSQTRMYEYILDNFALSESNTFARVSKRSRESNLQKMYFDNSKRLTISRMGADPILRTAKTSTASQAIAEKIIQDNQKLFEYLNQVTTDDLINFSESEKAIHTKKLYQLSSSVYQQINDAITVDQISKEELFNSLDQSTSGVFRRGMESLRAMPSGAGVEDFYENLNQDYFFNLRLRNMRYYQQYDQASAKGLIGSMQVARTPIPGKARKLNLNNLVESAKLAVDQITSSKRPNAADVAGTLEDAALRILAGERYSSGDKIFDEEARRQAKIVESILFFEDQQQAVRIAELEKAGTVSRQMIDQVPDEQRRSVEELFDAVENYGQTDSYNRTGQSRINRQRIASLFENKLFRRSAIGIAALAVASIGYNKVRDVTQDSVSGPPLLPGGSAYENEYVPDQIPGQTYGSPSVGSAYSSGVSYKINFSGSSDQIDKFNRQAGSLINGNMNTTIYNGLPRVDRNPYVEMGKTF